MLETDAKIPVEPVPIRQPICYPLGGTALAVKQMRDAGAGVGQIYHKLRISQDAYRDAIFEIRKQEAIMTRTTEEKRAEVLQMWADGVKQQQIADATGVPYGTVKGIIQKSKKQEQPEAAAPTPAAVALGEVMQHAAERQRPPEVVLEAIVMHCGQLQRTIEENKFEIEALQQRNATLQDDLDKLREWLQEVREDESTEA